MSKDNPVNLGTAQRNLEAARKLHRAAVTKLRNAEQQHTKSKQTLASAEESFLAAVRSVQES